MHRNMNGLDVDEPNNSPDNIDGMWMTQKQWDERKKPVTMVWFSTGDKAESDEFWANFLRD